jgi:branched-chain amino acid transport system ATP-binding protein
VLTLSDVSSGYGRITILRDVDLVVPAGQAVGVFGRNGAGKTTLGKTIVSTIRASSGDVMWGDRRLNRLRTEQVVKLGISLVPQSRGLFMSLTVAENLLLACVAWRLARKDVRERENEMYERFPVLGERRNLPAASLSGGEQQMLAIAKALMRRPKLLILDEPSTGLAPKVLESIAALIKDLRGGELSLVLTEQNIHWALGMVDVAHILEQGRIVESFDADDESARRADRLMARYLGATEVAATEATP